MTNHETVVHVSRYLYSMLGLINNGAVDRFVVHCHLSLWTMKYTQVFLNKDCPLLEDFYCMKLYTCTQLYHILCQFRGPNAAKFENPLLEKY